MSTRKKLLYPLTVVIVHFFISSSSVIVDTVRNVEMLTYMVPNVLEIYLYFFLWNLYIATIYGSSSSYMDSSGKRDFNSVFTLFVTSSIDSHVLLCLYGSKSGLLSLNNI